ncbi:MAG TPA: hypothetical protein PKV44_05165 [Bacillota bacterium]|nr:hypothetical protein [Bacillota bacterium]HPE38596.1 hypothetical protein [Bacillota bacterium]
MDEFSNFTYAAEDGAKTVNTAGQIQFENVRMDYAIHDIMDLKQRTEDLNFLFECMWELLEDRGCSLESLMDKMNIAVEKKHAEDLRNIDPKKKSATRVDCPSCGKPLQKSNQPIQRCIYCGMKVFNEEVIALGNDDIVDETTLPEETI